MDLSQLFKIESRVNSGDFMNISFFKDFRVIGLLRILNNIRSPSFLLFHFRNIAKCLHKGEVNVKRRYTFLVIYKCFYKTKGKILLLPGYTSKL